MFETICSFKALIQTNTFQNWSQMKNVGTQSSIVENILNLQKRL